MHQHRVPEASGVTANLGLVSDERAANGEVMAGVKRRRLTT
jgi:hypothetical protein